jgi:hypothetical protein
MTADELNAGSAERLLTQAASALATQPNECTSVLRAICAAALAQQLRVAVHGTSTRALALVRALQAASVSMDLVTAVAMAGAYAVCCGVPLDSECWDSALFAPPPAAARALVRYLRLPPVAT